MKVFYECKLKLNEADLKKQMIDTEKSINKIIYKSADEIELPLGDKLSLLQMHKHDLKIEKLLQFLKFKTENVKSIVDIE